MDQDQADQAKEAVRLISLLAVRKLEAAAKGEKSNFDRIEKQQIQVAVSAREIIERFEF